MDISTKEKIFRKLSALASGLLLLIGLPILIGGGGLISLPFLVGGVLFIPALRARFHRLTGVELRAVAIILIMVVSLFFPLVEPDMKAAQQRNENFHRAFAASRASLIAQMQEPDPTHKLADTIATASSYEAIADDTFKTDLSAARQKLVVQQQAQLVGDFKQHEASYTAQLRTLLRQRKYQEAATLAEKYQTIADKPFVTLAAQAAAHMLIVNQQAQQDSDDGQADLKSDAEIAIKHRSKDPDSVQFRNEYYKRTGNARIVCGEVNGKNSFGGYTGFEHFVSMGTIETSFVEGEVNDFAKVWNHFCR